MKHTRVKRLVFTNQYGGGYIGADEYDYKLSDDNILGAFHEVGKTVWQGRQLWMLLDDKPTFRVTVEVFDQYQKRWYEQILDAISRI